MESFRTWARWLLVTVGVIVLTSITVDATLSPSGISQSALGILASRAVPEEQCPEGMVLVASSEQKLCVDIFEASPGNDCPTIPVQNALDTRANIAAGACSASSASGMLPWGFATFHQAKELCAKAGKRLPTSEEWYAFSLGTPDEKGNATCNIKSETLRAGKEEDVCVNSYGVHDAIGNAWEWTDATVVNGLYKDTALPESGYVVSADQHGLATLTQNDAANPDFRSDYFWSEKEGEFGILRGGFYGSGSDAGLYSVHAKTPLSFASGAIGFRCVLTL